MSFDEHITVLGDEPPTRYCKWIYVGNEDHMYVRYAAGLNEAEGPTIQDMYEELFDHGLFDYVVVAKDTESAVLDGQAEGGKILAGAAEPDPSDAISSRAYSRVQQLLQHVAGAGADS